jgi:hypothetical protein
VIKKEGYAIFYSIIHNEHLLGGIHFTLKTDHRNLTFINSEGSPKVYRWKLRIQEFSFDLKYVKGEDNPIADINSRACPKLGDSFLGEYKDQILSVLAGPLQHKDAHEKRLHIPDKEYKQIASCHNSGKVGHFGVDTTIKQMEDRGIHFKRMRELVSTFICNCPVCQKMRAVHKCIRAHPFTLASYEPWKVMNIDSIGPLPPDENGNCYIIVIVCCFTRWVELFPAKDATAIEAARALMTHCGRFIVHPTFLRSDNGSQYVNAIIAELCLLLGTAQELITPYSHEENGIVERMNKEVMRHLRDIVFDNKSTEQWGSHCLLFVQRILNSQEKTSTGVSPAVLLFGSTISLGREMLRRQRESDGPEGPLKRLSEYMDKMLSSQALYIKIAQEKQLATDSHHMGTKESDYNDYPVNSYVLFAHPDGPKDKMSCRRTGPFQVVNHIGNTYTIENLINGKHINTHIGNLVAFNYDATRTIPKDVAMYDMREFVVESVLNHRGDRNRRTQMEFLIRWKGFTIEWDTWEPYGNLRDNDQLIAYLRSNKLKSLIPTRHK